MSKRYCDVKNFLIGNTIKESEESIKRRRRVRTTKKYKGKERNIRERYPERYTEIYCGDKNIESNDVKVGTTKRIQVLVLKVSGRSIKV